MVFVNFLFLQDFCFTNFAELAWLFLLSLLELLYIWEIFPQVWLVKYIFSGLKPPQVEV